MNGVGVWQLTASGDDADRMLSHHGAGALEAPAIVGNNDIVRPTDSPVASTNSFSCPVPSVQPSLVEIDMCPPPRILLRIPTQTVIDPLTLTRFGETHSLLLDLNDTNVSCILLSGERLGNLTTVGWTTTSTRFPEGAIHPPVNTDLPCGIVERTTFAATSWSW